MVMQAVGNAMANRIWQHNAPAKERATAEASREQKEQWIRTIYVKKASTILNNVDFTFFLLIRGKIAQVPFGDDQNDVAPVVANLPVELAN
ncbi:hypothetical protein niasHT_030181 [Heterodera trifolii]|uniref:Arf-GAP domain-containing protein n=1 Tax=Heterodera trifolii TaxID=157864 RepID=A0ABD2K2S2_9BILA